MSKLPDPVYMLILWPIGWAMELYDAPQAKEES